MIKTFPFDLISFGIIFKEIISLDTNIIIIFIIIIVFILLLLIIIIINCFYLTHPL